MNTSVPWSIRDISAETREAAKDAARRAGVSLGEWLDTIIAERASDLGVETSRIDNRQRLDAVAAELRRLAKRTAGLETQFDDEAEYAATGTDGASQARPQVGGLPGSPMDPMRMMSERLADFERRTSSSASDPRPPAEPSLAADRPPERPAPAARPMSSAVREAIAEISLRQAALEADEAPPKDATAAAAPTLVAAPPATPEPVERRRWRDRMAADDGTEDLDLVRRPNMADGVTREAAGQISPELGVEPSIPTVPPVPAASPDSASMFESLRRDLRDAIKEIDPRPNVEELDRQMRDLGRKVEGIGAVMPPSTVLSDIGEQTRQMRDLLTTAATRPPAVDLVQRQMAELHDRMSELSAAPPPASRLDDDSWTQIRDLFDRVPSGSVMDSLDQRMRELSAKIDSGMSEPAPSRLLEDLSRRIDEIQASIKSPSAAAIDTRPLESLVRGIADRIEDARIATADFQHLEQMMGSLAAKIETGGPRVDTQRLETQISRLGDRLDRSEASLSALDTVEHTLGELFSQLEETRHAAIDAAENAARTAARDTLRAAMHSQPAGGSDGQSDLSEQLSQTLTEVRQHYEESDRRNQATLLGLHQTMEKLVEHLAKLNVTVRPDEVPGARPVPQKQQPEEREPPKVAEAGGAPVVQAEPAYQERFRQERASRRAAKTEEAVDSLIEPGAGRSFRDAAGPADPQARKAAVPPAAPQALAAPAREGDGPANYIAAARRAAQAAQASAAAQKTTKSSRTAGDARRTASAPVLERARQFIAQRRRPILLSLAGLVLLLGALEVVKVVFEDTNVPTRVGAADAAAPNADRSGATAEDGAALGTIAAIPRADAPKVSEKIDQASGSADRPAASAADPRLGPAARPAPPPTGNNPFLASAGAPAEAVSDSLRKLAASGDAAAEYELGLRFSEGRTVNRDTKLAASWFEKAASQGLAPAQYRIGSAYEKGIGVTRDPALAMAWYGRAAEAGNVKAMHNLAVMAADGSVGKSDYAKAAAWFAKAAGYGIRDSQFNLAILYAKGLGIEQSLAQSYTWFAIAASQGDDDAGKKRDEVATKLDTKTLAAAKVAADTFRPQPTISAANEVSPPPGGWDGAAAPSSARPAASAPKGTTPKVTQM